MNQQQQAEGVMALLSGIWKHTPLGIVIEALMKSSAAHRARKLYRSRAPMVARNARM